MKYAFFFFLPITLLYSTLYHYSLVLYLSVVLPLGLVGVPRGLVGAPRGLVGVPRGLIGPPFSFAQSAESKYFLSYESKALLPLSPLYPPSHPQHPPPACYKQVLTFTRMRAQGDRSSAEMRSNNNKHPLCLLVRRERRKDAKEEDANVPFCLTTQLE